MSANSEPILSYWQRRQALQSELNKQAVIGPWPDEPTRRLYVRGIDPVLFDSFRDSLATTRRSDMEVAHDAIANLAAYTTALGTHELVSSYNERAVEIGAAVIDLTEQIRYTTS